ncbi:hypothetical protein IJH24_00950 [Candidatus Saccharibacteria bacterium]|nr:hypothetical protein [Candidatus Saccharibacteria bacterium]
MEQNTNTGEPMTPVVDNKQKNGNGLKIATAIACVVAVCGIGFGAYGMIQSTQKDSQISDLKVQIKDSEEATTTIKIPDEAETTIENEATLAVTDYIFIEDWGLKIKMPEELKMISYMFQHYKYEGQEDRTSVVITGTEENVEELPDYANLNKCHGLGSISRRAKGSQIVGNTAPVFSDANWDYHYGSPQVNCSENASELEQEQNIVKILQDILTNPDNYSTF